MRRWIGLALGVGLLGAAAAVAGGRRRELAGVRNAEYARGPIVDELDGAERRARAAGARGELEYAGAGAEGIVLCDESGKAFKVGRPGRGGLHNEAAWFRRAMQIPSVRPHVARFYRYDDEHDVLVRECVRPSEHRERSVGRRVDEKRLHALHERIAKAMQPYGYGRPEYKPDSYVYSRRGPILVDAGFAVKFGRELVRRALDVANGRAKLDKQRINDLAWELRMERGESIPEPIANRLLKRLQQIEPSVEL